MQLALFSPLIHSKENNPESQAYLIERRKDFETQGEKIIHLLNSGERLTVRTAVTIHCINSLPRRIKDLEDQQGYRISKDWVYINGRKSHKVWFMRDEDIQFNQTTREEAGRR